MKALKIILIIKKELIKRNDRFIMFLFLLFWDLSAQIINDLLVNDRGQTNMEQIGQ